MELGSSHAAREAARADAKARAAKKRDPAQAQLLELERLKVQCLAVCMLVCPLDATDSGGTHKVGRGNAAQGSRLGSRERLLAQSAKKRCQRG